MYFIRFYETKRDILQPEYHFHSKHMIVFSKNNYLKTLKRVADVLRMLSLLFRAKRVWLSLQEH